MNTLREVAKALKLRELTRDCSFSSFSIDTRSLQPGALFVALKGLHFDGHDFITQAKQQGASAVMVETPSTIDLPQLKVPNTRRALSLLASQHRQKFTLPTIALTGSCGKTTTKEMLTSILSLWDKTLVSPKSFNNALGVPLTLLELKSDHRFAVLELGASAPGEIAQLTRQVKPKVAMILNIGPAHLAGFDSLAGVAQAKAEIFEGLDSEGIAIMNADDPWISTCLQSLRSPCKILSFGQAKTAEVAAENVQVDPTGRAYFRLITPKGSQDIHLALLGRHQVHNALAAATAAMSVGASLSIIKSGLEAVLPLSGRLKPHPGYNGSHLLDDTYNANPRSVQVALATLRDCPNQHLFILGEMGELGVMSSAYHKQVGIWARQYGVHQMLTYGDLTKAASLAFGKGAFHFETQALLINYLQGHLTSGWTVLIKGSRSAGMEKVVKALRV